MNARTGGDTEDGKKIWRHAEMLSLLTERIVSVVGTEEVPLAACNGRILAADLIAPRAIPLHDNAAVDGYAFRHADYVAGGGKLPVAGRVAAEPGAPVSLPEGQACQIFTGALMPVGADTVVMREMVTLIDQGGFCVIPAGLAPGANRRRAGEDVTPGTVMMAKAHRLRPQDVAAIASTGKTQVTCFRRLKLGLISSGDEIIRPGAPLALGQSYDANHYLISGLLADAPFTLDDGGILPDDRVRSVDALEHMSRHYDAIITSGGVSQGDEDHIGAAIDALGRRYVRNMAIKPGRPMTFGRIKDCPVFGLPGNPVAVMVCCLLYVRPALMFQAGAGWDEPRRFWVRSGFHLAKKIGRREFIRVRIETDGQENWAHRYPRDGSALISSLREADGLLEAPEQLAEIVPNQKLSFLSFTFSR